MTRPRSTLVSLSETAWYHVMSRCVRRAYLCGEDQHTGRDFGHRRGWIARRARQLAGVFAIDVAAYAVMSNHYHLVVHIDERRARNWSDTEVLRRWRQLFDGPPVVQRATGGILSAGEALQVAALTATYRARLTDLSWFMRVLNESIARRANAEDEVTGRFWEGRFKSQALLDEKAVLTAMTYVDLNPIRAGMADTPEESDHTSVAERLAQLRQFVQTESPTGDMLPCSLEECPESGPAVASSGGAGIDVADVVVAIPRLRHERLLAQLAPQPLMPFDGAGRLCAAIPFVFEDYVELVEASGRCQHPTKRGRIGEDTPQLLVRLGIDAERFIACSAALTKHFGSAVGAPGQLVELCAARQVKYLRGMLAARRTFPMQAAQTWSR